MYKAIFWDNDGVLVNTEQLYFEATNKIFFEIGFELTKEMYIRDFLKNSSGAWYILEANGFSKNQINELREKRNKLYNEYLRKGNLLINGVKETVEVLSKKYFMSIVTSSLRTHFETIHHSTGIINYFNSFFTLEDYTSSKPDPEPYLLALKKSGFVKSEVVIIEDSERGLKSALSAGIDCFIIPNELTRQNDFTGASKKLNSVSELSDYL